MDVEKAFKESDAVNQFSFTKGYKAAEEALKCCGACRWCEYIAEPGIEDNYCLNKKSEDYDYLISLAHVCEHFEGRE